MPVLLGLDACTGGGADDKARRRVEAGGGNGRREGEGGELGLEVGDAGDCSGEVGEVERGGLFEVESEAYAEEAEESVTADLRLVLGLNRRFSSSSRN